MIKKSNEDYLIGVYRYTLHPLNGSRTHASALFPAPTVIITDSQEGQMFHRRRRHRRIRRRCRSRIIADDGGTKGFPIGFDYVSVSRAGSRGTSMTFLLFRRSPILNLRRHRRRSRPPLASSRHRPPIFEPNLYPSTYLHISCRPLFSRTWENLRSLSRYLSGGPSEDERLDVETKWTIVQLFALGGASASHPTRAV